jgi:hypothetical protein
MQANILEAFKAQDTLYKEVARLKKYIFDEPEGELKKELETVLIRLEKAKTSIETQVSTTLVNIPIDAEKYIKKEDNIKVEEGV